jgi:hypothetical protein
VLSLFFLNAYSQETREDKPNYFEENHQYLKKIEEKYDVEFFYKRLWLENEQLNKINPEGDLKALLNKVFEGTFIKFHIHEKNYIILTYYNELDQSIDIDRETTVRYAEETPELRDVDKEELKREENIIHQIGNPGGRDKNVVLSGRVTDFYSGDPVEGVNIVLDEGKRGTVSGTDGRYELSMPKGYHVVYYFHVGMEETLRKVRIYSDGTMNVPLVQKVEEIGQVTVMTEDRRKEKQMAGFEKMEMQEFMELPTFMGETDIIQHSLLLPGIQSVREGDVSFSVRGGKGDQNLILIDDMHSYSVSHFFGFFPGINPNTINSANLYKSAIPIEYGNRLSSVYDIQTKKGNFEKFSLQGGINPISGNVALEGPIIKDKLSFVAGGRSTYSSYVIDRIDVQQLNGSNASFYDYQAKLDYKISDQSLASVFYYNSKDDFVLHRDTAYAMYNELGTANYKTQLNQDMTLDVSAGFTRYRNENTLTSAPEEARKETQEIFDIKFKSLLNYEYNNRHTFKGGIEVLYNQISPWELNKGSDESLVNPILLEDEKAITSSVFIGDEMLPFPRFTLNAGLRYSLYTYLGPKEKYLYEDNIIVEENIEGTESYGNNSLVHFDHGLGIRVNGSYNAGAENYINFSYNRNRQYIHMLTNSQSASPLDSWKLSDSYIPPQIGNQVSLGYNKTYERDMIDVSVDFYYKSMKDIKDFIRGSDYKFNAHPETELVNALGRAYGAEFMVKKGTGRINGWISYTYSRVFIKSASDIVEKNINNGEFYPANSDKPHNLSAVINLKPSRRLEISNIINYSTGVPVTLPAAKMQFNDAYSIVYSDRNEFRMPNYFRWDLSLTYKGSLKKNKLVDQSWTFSVYNLTGRMNPHSIYFVQKDNNIKGYKLSIVGQPIPTITYKFKF